MRTLRSAVIVATHPGSIRMVLQAHAAAGHSRGQGQLAEQWRALSHI
jgi:hypothetical protein